MQPQIFDALVIGAGIVGAACAEELSRSGLRVGICEADIIGGGATAAGMGHLATMDDSEEQFALTRYSQSLWNVLAGELPPDTEFLRCGALWIAADDVEMAEVERKHGFYSARGVPVSILDEKQLAEAEPKLRHGLAGGLFVPGDSVCYPPCVASYLVSKATRQGAVLFLPAVVAEILPSGVRLQDGSTIASKLVVLATGSWANRLIPGLVIKPRKGHLVITDRYPGFVHHQLIELGYLKSAHATEADSVAFNIQPRATGQLLIGSSRQFGATDSAAEQSILDQMLRRALEYMPGLLQLSAIRVWTGFRAATPDKLPLIGPCTEYPNVYLATGHEGLGISTSLATARLLADQILNRPSEIPFEPYLPERNYALHA
jgi:glycine/D-amino acid oxidase-like deaminating enzyme